MTMLGAALLAVFGVYGMLTFAGQVLDRLCRKDCSSVLIYVRGESESIESTVRTLMLKNPGAEIIITDEGKSKELREILDMLCRDCARVHIKEDG